MRFVAVAMVLGAVVSLPAMADQKVAPVTLQDQPAPVPANGVDPEPRHGAFAEAGLGVFTTLGGSAGLSNAQTYLSMVVGGTVGDHAAIFGGLGIGSVSSNCYAKVTGVGTCTAADSFESAYLELGGSFGGEVAHRLQLSGKIVAGLTQLAPGPLLDVSTNTVPGSALGIHVGLGVTLDYATHLDHFTVGLELMGRYTLAYISQSGPSLLSIAILPRVRYVF